MQNWTSTVLVLAQGEGAKEGGGGDQQAPNVFSMMLPLVLVGFVFYFLILRPQQRERAQKEKLLSALKKNDRVVTIGGIIGQVVSVSPDEKEIVLKVDDNTRIRFRRSSIQSVLTDGTSADEAAKINS